MPGFGDRLDIWRPCRSKTLMGTSPSDVIVVMPRASDTMGTNAACEFSEAKTMRPICLAVLAVDSD